MTLALVSISTAAPTVSDPDACATSTLWPNAACDRTAGTPDTTSRPLTTATRRTNFFIFISNKLMQIAGASANDCMECPVLLSAQADGSRDVMAHAGQSTALS